MLESLAAQATTATFNSPALLEFISSWQCSVGHPGAHALRSSTSTPYSRRCLDEGEGRGGGCFPPPFPAAKIQLRFVACVHRPQTPRSAHCSLKPPHWWQCPLTQHGAMRILRLWGFLCVEHSSVICSMVRVLDFAQHLPENSLATTVEDLRRTNLCHA